MKAALLTGLMLVAVAGCEPNNSATPPADNTKINERDRNASALTPGDQGDNEVDRGITQRIRQEVMKSDSLSMTAKNVKIITINSIVTLRGPVKDDGERTELNRIATGTAGVARVDNQLEIASN